MNPNDALVCLVQASEQPRSETDTMREFTREFVVRHNLSPKADALMETTVDFARFCVAPQTSRAGQQAACMYIAWLLFLDDSPLQASRLEAFSTAFQADGCKDREGPRGAMTELKAAVQDLADSKGVRPQECQQRIVAMMAAQHWEQVTLAREGRGFSESEYARYRPDTIGNGALLSLMKLDAGIDLERLDPLTRARTRLLEELCNRLTALSNDVLSHHREEHDPTALSMVRVLVNTSGISWSEAVSQTTALHNREMENYARLRGELLAISKDPAVHRFIEITDADIAGNMASMEVIASRYRITARTPISWLHAPPGNKADSRSLR